jgi:hypothetical protein
MEDQIPPEIADVVLAIGEAEWGSTAPLSATKHAAHVKQSVKITAETFEQKGPQPMNGLYVNGTDTIICHTGTSPNSAQIARALTGAWNRLLAECRTRSPRPTVADGDRSRDRP